MKKALPVLAALGAVAAFAIYKIKKEEQKKIIDLDEGLLYDDESDAVEDFTNNVKENCEAVKEEALVAANDIKAHAETAIKEFSQDFPELLKEEVEDLKETIKSAICDLQEAGTVIEKERPIQHLVTFTNAEDLEAFKNAIINRGYVVSVGDEENTLNVLHICPLDIDKLAANVLYIANEARKHHGCYSGWFSK